MTPEQVANELFDRAEALMDDISGWIGFEPILISALAEAERRGAEKAWDEGYVDRLGVPPLYDDAGNWPNPYRADRIAQDTP